MSTSLRFLSDERDARVDVIFIHGLRLSRGAPESDWASKLEGGQQFWPQWLDDDLDGVRVGILTYEADASNWNGSAIHLEDRALNILATLGAYEIGSRPLIFIAHSLGGLVVKAMIRKALSPGSTHGRIAGACAGVVFLATPHTGAALSDLARILKPLRASKAVETLSRDNESLLHLATEYRSWAASDATSVRHLVLRETKPVFGLLKVVPGGSADPGIAGADPIPIDADHFEIALPTSRSNLVYQLTKRLAHEIVESLDSRSAGEVESVERGDASTEALARLSRGVIERRGLVEIEGWQSLLAHARFDWRAEVARRVTELRDIGFSEALAAQLMDRTIGLEALAERLRAANFDELGRNLSPSRPTSADAALDWLRDQGRRPSFRTVVPISGTWGAGKSQLALALCRVLCASGDTILVVPQRDVRAPLAARLVKAFALATESEVSDLRSVERWLLDHGRTVVYVLDDAHLDPEVGLIADLIADSVASGRSTWIVTADSDRFDLLMGGARSRVWRRHGLDTGSTTQSGWLELDHINATEKVGVQILRNWGVNVSSKDLDDVTRDPDLLQSGLLCEPWSAWLRVDTVAEHAIPLWHADEQFAAALWAEYSDRLAQFGVSAALSHRLRSVLVSEFVDQWAGDIEFGAVLSAIGSAAWSRGEARRSIWEFVASGAVGHVSHDQPFDGDSANGESLLAEPAVLWGRWLFSVASSGENADPGVPLASWLASAAEGNWTAQLVAMQWFSGVVLPGVHEGDGGARRITREFVQRVAADKSALWIALRSATRQVRVTAAEWIFAAQPRAAGERECLLFLRLVQSYRNSEWPRGQRLELLSDRWYVIGVWDLGAVALDVASSLVNFAVLSHLRATLHALEGFEKTGYASELAEVLVLGYADKHAWAVIFAQLTGYLHTQRPASRRGSEVVLSHMSDALKTQEPPSGMWHHLCSRAAREFVLEEGMGAYDQLRRWGWFDDDYHVVVRRAMRQSAHTELGGVYRRRGRVGKEAFLRFVGRLVDGDLSARTSAVFIIKHTEVTRGQRLVRVADEFQPFLVQLSEDRALVANLRELRDLLEANGIVDAKVRHVRSAVNRGGGPQDERGRRRR